VNAYLGDIRPDFAKGAEDASWSPDSRRLAAFIPGGWKNRVQVPPTTVLWDARTSREFSDTDEDESHVIRPMSNDFQYQWSPDSNCLPAVSYRPPDKTGYLTLYVNGPAWEVRRTWEVRRIEAHSGKIVGILWSPDSRRLASLGADGLVKVWDRKSGKELRQFPVPGYREPHPSGDKVELMNIAWSPSGDRLATADGNGDITVRDTRTWDVVQTLYGHTTIATLAWHPHRERLASGSEREIKLWDTRTGQEVLSLAGSGAGLAWSADGWRLETCTTVWDATPVNP
jgi:WD40 repeat protein